MFRLIHAAMARLLRQIVRDRRAASAMEYGLVLALVCLGLFVLIQQLGGQRPRDLLLTVK